MNKNLISNNFIGIKNIENKAKREMTLVAIAYVLLVVMSQVKIYLPFTPVPITGQTFAVFLIGLSLSRKLSAITIIAYILSATIGLPVLAGFKAGFPLISATGGYVIGFFFAAQICGYYAEKGWTKSFIKLIFILLIASIMIYTFGLLQLSMFVPKGKVFALGLIPFIPGDIFKIVLTTLVLRSSWNFIKE